MGAHNGIKGRCGIRNCLSVCNLELNTSEPIRQLSCSGDHSGGKVNTTDSTTGKSAGCLGNCPACSTANIEQAVIRLELEGIKNPVLALREATAEPVLTIGVGPSVKSNNVGQVLFKTHPYTPVHVLSLNPLSQGSQAIEEVETLTYLRSRAAGVRTDSA